jgi:CcmD family protein
MNVNGYLFAAYCIIWIILFIYLVVLHKKQKEVGEQLAELSRKVGD